MTENELVRSLNSIGKRSFVENYAIYSDPNLTKEKKVNKLTELYSLNGATIRVSYAENIFSLTMSKFDSNNYHLIK